MGLYVLLVKNTVSMTLPVVNLYSCVTTSPSGSGVSTIPGARCRAPPRTLLSEYRLVTTVSQTCLFRELSYI